MAVWCPNTYSWNKSSTRSNNVEHCAWPRREDKPPCWCHNRRMFTKMSRGSLCAPITCTASLWGRPLRACCAPYALGTVDLPNVFAQESRLPRDGHADTIGGNLQGWRGSRRMSPWKWCGRWFVPVYRKERYTGNFLLCPQQAVTHRKVKCLWE